ncbi:MAG TPA: helix-turn-helix transcriptional regulator [Chloroflexota bacterium]|nr:helix-turn-helix transcriptional regulator [Chloroflexota bacterium]
MLEARAAAARSGEGLAAPGAVGAAGDPGGPSFGETLRELRLVRGVSQAAVAARAGIDRSYVNRLEAGERGAPAEAGTEALARALDLTDAEADRLFAAAGLLPRSLRAVGPTDPTILLLAQRLTDPRLSPEARAALRATVETIARCWADPSGSSGPSGLSGPTGLSGPSGPSGSLGSR